MSKAVTETGRSVEYVYNQFAGDWHIADADATRELRQRFFGGNATNAAWVLCWGSLIAHERRDTPPDQGTHHGRAKVCTLCLAALEHLTRGRMRAALAELVALKDLKDAEGKTAEYERRQPLAWAAARKALGMAEDGDEQTV